MRHNILTSFNSIFIIFYLHIMNVFFANNSTLQNNTQSLLGSALRWIAYGRTQRKKEKRIEKYFQHLIHLCYKRQLSTFILCMYVNWHKRRSTQKHNYFWVFIIILWAHGITQETFAARNIELNLWKNNPLSLQLVV